MISFAALPAVINPDPAEIAASASAAASRPDIVAIWRVVTIVVARTNDEMSWDSIAGWKADQQHLKSGEGGGQP